MRYAALLLLLITGCAVHPHFYMARGVVPNPELDEAKKFIRNIAERMPLWDADEPFAGFEREEISLVKADILSTQHGDHFFENVDKLHADWDALLALDERLRKSYVI